MRKLVMFGAIGNQPGELLTYQPTWHHGHAVMRFIPNLKGTPSTPEPGPDYEFKNAGGYQFYKHPDPASYKLNKVIFDLRHDPDEIRNLADNPPHARRVKRLLVRLAAQQKHFDDDEPLTVLNPKPAMWTPPAKQLEPTNDSRK